MKRISFEQSALAAYQEIALKDRKIFSKINSLLKEIVRTPFEGSGKPEELKHEYSNYWSRRINPKDRLVYKVLDDEIIIAQCSGHYLDK